MAQLDLQIDEKPVRSRNGRQDYRLAQQPRPRGLIAQVTTLVLQPGVFFRTLPAFQNSRQWLLVAILILALTGLMAVRQAEMTTSTPPATSPDSMMPPDMMAPGLSDGGAISGDFGGLPPDMGMPVDPGVTGGASDSGGSVSTTWTTALIAGGALVAAWLIQALLLSEVTLFNGRAPQLGLNLQIAIYASVPLALMTGLQALYYSAGGDMGEPGLAGLLTEWPELANQTPFVQALLMSLASRLTLFWLWSLLLLYVGARHALRGRWWASWLVVFAWAAILIVTPVLTGAITAPPTEEAIPAGDFPGDMSALDGGLSLEGHPGEPSFEGLSGEMSPEAGAGEPASVGRPGLESEPTGDSAALTESEPPPVDDTGTTPPEASADDPASAAPAALEPVQSAPVSP
jgi:hypothetical protein